MYFGTNIRISGSPTRKVLSTIKVELITAILVAKSELFTTTLIFTSLFVSPDKNSVAMTLKLYAPTEILSLISIITLETGYWVCKNDGNGAAG